MKLAFTYIEQETVKMIIPSFTRSTLENAAATYETRTWKIKYY